MNTFEPNENPEATEGANSESYSNQDNLALQHQLEEWKHLNEYLNKIEFDYARYLTAGATVLATIFFLGYSNSRISTSEGLLLVPPGFICLIGYISRQHRLEAMLRGYLASLENKMNKSIGLEVHNWHSSVFETLFVPVKSKNFKTNYINQGLMVPLVLTWGFIMYLIFVKTLNVLKGYGTCVPCIYWILIIIFSVYVAYPFLENNEYRLKAKKIHDRKGEK